MLLTLCSKVTQGLSLDETIALAIRFGFDGIEIFGLPEHLPADIPSDEVVRYADVLADAGLVVSCLATYVGPYHEADAQRRAAMLDELRRYCQFADLLGCRLVRQLSAHRPPDELTDEQWRRTAEGLRAAAEVAGEYEKIIVLETHDNQVVETPDAAARLLEMIGRDNVGLTFDPGNHVGHLEEWLEAMGGDLGRRVYNVHVKDATAGRQQKLLGEGEVDYAAVWAALAAAGYDGPVGVECHVKPDGQWTVERIIEHEVAALRRSLEQSPLAERLQG